MASRKVNATRHSRHSVRRAPLLLEIGVEELPPTTLQLLAQAFAAAVVDELRQAELVDVGVEAECKYRYFATPRRLAVLVDEVLAQQQQRVVERRGPTMQLAFDHQNKPRRAALGFAKSCGVNITELAKMETASGAWLVYRQTLTGAKLGEVVTESLEKILRQLPIAKRMRWGDGQVEFVRPAHWLLALHGDKPLKTTALGLTAARYTRGHRFHADKKLRIPHAKQYESLLATEGKVIADFARRRDTIKKQIAQLITRANRAAKNGAARLQMDAQLMDLVTSLVEFPHALLGKFDARFLKLPRAVLVSAMRDQQKYFHLTDDNGKLLPAFIAVSNIKSQAPQQVRQGNERVLRARLADAEFFWRSDLKTPLAARVAQLENVLFHNELGSLHHKSMRVVQLAADIAARLHADVEKTKRAALLSKADLVTDMVGEFPNLQGIIGNHYARHSGEHKLVADAIEQHYLPRYAGDKLPRTPIAQAVAIAERVDSLLGMFACGESPRGDRDPFALRRAALGVLRILIEQKLDLDVYQLLQTSQRIYEKSAATTRITAIPNAQTIAQVFAFMLERLTAYYQALGYRGVEIAAVRACKPSKPLDFHRRLQALSRFFKQQPAAAASFAAAHKRIVNLLQKADLNDWNESDDAQPRPRYDSALFQQDAEVELARRLEQIGEQARAHFADNRYDQGFTALSKLKQPVDSFFDEVMVLHDERAIRNNRLALLNHIRLLFLCVADISCLQGKG